VINLEGIILAAGFSSRFNFEDGSFQKFLLPLKKSIILNYVIAAIFSAGIRKINIIVDEKVDKSQIINSCFSFGKEFKINYDQLKLNLIENKFPERENGFSLFLGINAVSSENFVLSMADHIFSENIYSILIKNYRNEDILLATDPMKIDGIYDLEDCTKVKGNSSHINEIGKQILNYNRLDMGVFIMKTTPVRRIAKKVEKGKAKFGVSEIVLSAIDQKLEVSYFDLENTIWVDVDNDNEYEKVKKNFEQSSNFNPFNLDNCGS